MDKHRRTLHDSVLVVAGLGLLTATWFWNFPLQAPFDWGDITFEGVYLFIALVSMALIYRLQNRSLSFGWTVFVLGLWIDFLDEFTREPDLIDTYIEGVLTSCGLGCVALGFFLSYRRQVAELSRARRAEQSLRESEERFRNLMDHIPGIAIQGYTPSGTVFYWNKESERIYGYSAAEAIGRDLGELIIPAGLQSHYRQALERGARATTSGEFMPAGELQLRRKDGSPVPVYSIHTVVCRQEKTPLLYCIDVDLSERKRTEEEVRRNEEKYRTILANMEEGYYELDLKGNFTFFNDSVCRILGYDAEELMGMNNRAYTSPETARRMYAIFNQVYRTGEPAEIRDYEVIRKDGTTRVLELSAHLMRDANGAPVGFRGVARDVTERRQAEEDRKRLEAQILQAQKMEAVGTLAGGIAHDFNNLLQAVHGYAELLLLKKDLDDNDRRWLQNILRAARRGEQLTQQLLTFSRKVESEKQPTDINGRVREVQALLERTIPKMITIELDLEPDLHLVVADSGQIVQALMNLAVNAKDAMPEGGCLRITTANVTLGQSFCQRHPEAKPGEYVLVSVSDTGWGMDEDTKKQMFDPFFTTKEVGKGTGLGLAIVYGIVKEHQGLIEVDSRPGEGSTFNIYLPAAIGEASEGEVDSEDIPVACGDETVLIVDDEADVRDSAEQIFVNFGYRVLTAEDGIAGLQMFKRYREEIDLVILDLIMPKMGGEQCLRELRRLDPEAKILIASGYAPEDDTSKLLSLGACGFVRKPYQAQQMMQAVRTVLKDKNLAVEAG